MLTRDDSIGVITVNNPPVNALSNYVRKGILNAVGEALVTPEILAVIITGTGNTFSAGADINAVDHLGWSPLHAACSAGQTVIVYYLLKCVCGPPLLQDRRGIHGIVRERKSIWSLPQDALH